MSFFDEIWKVSLELAPWLFFGAIVSALLHKWLPTHFIRTQLSGYSGIVKAVLLGVPLPLCSCGVIPAGIGLKKDGASDGSSLAFLISTPQTGVDSVLVSAAFLGWPFALLKVIAATTTGIVGGLLTEVTAPEVQEQTENIKKPDVQPSWHDAWTHGVQLLRSIWGWLVIGILLSAALTTLMDKELLATVPDGFFSLVIALLISLPLYVCATASVPIAAALVSGGLPLSAALVFLMAGPASNMATIGSIYKTFGSRITLIYLSTIIIGSMGFAWGFDFLLSAPTVGSEHIHEHPVWQIPFSIALFLSFAYFGYEDLTKRFQVMPQNKSSTSNNKYYVSGLHCGGCVSKLENKLSTHEKVQNGQVDLASGTMLISGEIPRDELQELVEGLGFELLHTDLSLDIDGLHCGGCVSKLENKLKSTAGVEHVSVQRNPDVAFISGKLSLINIEEAIISVGFTSKEATKHGY
jgi:uncharacterized membrane protein YraQ (UPF0718 family)/copper chaperone CopZ